MIFTRLVFRCSYFVSSSVCCLFYLSLFSIFCLFPSVVFAINQMRPKTNGTYATHNSVWVIINRESSRVESVKRSLYPYILTDCRQQFLRVCEAGRANLHGIINEILIARTHKKLRSNCIPSSSRRTLMLRLFSAIHFDVSFIFMTSVMLRTHNIFNSKIFLKYSLDKLHFQSIYLQNICIFVINLRLAILRVPVFKIVSFSLSRNYNINNNNQKKVVPI